MNWLNQRKEKKMTSCNCYCGEGNYAEVCEKRYPVARKKHRCCECFCDIEPGQKYEYVKGLWDGYWDKYKTCMSCAQIRKDFCKNGFVYEGLAEALHECFDIELI